MQIHKLPDCIVEFMRAREYRDPDYPGRGGWSYYLAGAGRAITRTRMAADVLAVTSETLEADYHAYAGISSARTSLDAFACWINAWCGLGIKMGSNLGIKTKEFRKLVAAQAPSMMAAVDQLGDLASDIDRYRQPAQHREGLYVRGFYLTDEDMRRGPANRRDHPPVWHIANLWHVDATPDDPVAEDLLREWAGRIEAAACAALNQV